MPHHAPTPSKATITSVSAMLDQFGPARSVVVPLAGWAAVFRTDFAGPFLRPPPANAPRQASTVCGRSCSFHLHRPVYGFQEFGIIFSLACLRGREQYSLSPALRQHPCHRIGVIHCLPSR